MRTFKRQFAMVAGMLVTFFLLLPVALAGSNGLTQDAREMGCIVREPVSARFLRNDSVDKKAIGEAAVNAHRLRGTKVIDPCLTGQVRNIPAAVYAALAKKHPEKFLPLEAEDQSVVPLKKAATGVIPAYHYVWLDETVPLPPGFLGGFSPSAITNDGRVYGNAFAFNESDGTFINYVAVFEDGNLTILQEGSAITANQGGTIGGSVLIDPENFFEQAALFRGNEVQLIPRLPGEISSFVLEINDSGMALVFSVDENFNGTLALYKNGKVTPLDFGPVTPSVFSLRMNNQGIISGTTFIEGLGYRGFRFDPRTGLATLLHPLPTESYSWAMAINNRGDILGYSFVFSGIERIGVWDKEGVFHTYFVEGTPEFPTISNDLKFNDDNLIVITQVRSPASESGNSYLIPSPGVRLNLADLVTDMPPEHGSLWFVQAINNHGNIIGSTLTSDFFSSFNFLLERTGAGNK
ncbi:hypothetical protein [Nitrosomonas sp. Nm132]|uniref:hypothetical protein n=1 Tax=Nitrosomonas sp. Nm132 TaxID=1881053 RepID=UPI0008880086|nr:hypothetical protein [Nitrosomonas sp. Nm132]SDH57012.1 hypothetical protein SAMN05428952_101825 [Nitrosomonas sp. Nm132]